MNCFIDTNLLLDVLARREPFYPRSALSVVTPAEFLAAQSFERR